MWCIQMQTNGVGASRTLAVWAVCGVLWAFGSAEGLAAATCADVPGDIDTSGKVDVVDVQCSIVTSLWALAGANEAPPACVKNDPDSADMNCSGEPNVVDVQMVISLALGQPLGVEVDVDNNGCPDDCEPVDLGVDLEFLGDMQLFCDGLTLQPGGVTYTGHPLSVTIQTWPPDEKHQVVLKWSTGGGATKSAGFLVDSLGAGPFGNNIQWVAQVPASELSDGVDVEFWIEATGGTVQMDFNDNGNPFVVSIMDVNEAFSVGWSTPGAYSFSKCWNGPSGCSTGWKYNPTLPNPLPVGFSEYQVYGAWWHPAIEVYIPNITDLPVDAGLSAFLAQFFLRVEVQTDLFSGIPGGELTTKPLPFVERQGNNFVYQWMLLATGAPYPQSLVGFLPPAPGTYTYHYRVSFDGGQTFFTLDPSAVTGGAPLQLQWSIPQP